MFVPELTVKTIKKIEYKKGLLFRGYAGQALMVDLSENKIGAEKIPTEARKLLTGGRGLGLYYLAGECFSEDTRWFDKENALCIASGPLAGCAFPGAGKSTVVTLSPLTGIPIDSNVGGHFGSFLKFAGFDVLCVSGKSDGDIVIFIDGVKQAVEIIKMEGLPVYSHEVADFLTDYFGEEKPQDIAVVSTGPGAKNVLYGMLNFSWYDRKRGRVRNKQAGRGGTGTVFSDKGLRAILVKWDSKKMDLNPADAGLLKKVIAEHAKEIRELDPEQNRMSAVGTTHLTEIMGAPELQLLPVNNFQFGTHPDVDKLSAKVFERMFDKGFDGCSRGCVMACSHGIKNFVPETGPYAGHKVWVDGPEYETIAALGSNLGIFDPRFVAEANFYCDAYGLDTISTGVSIAFAMECFERGLIDRVFTGGLDLSFGNREAALRLLHLINQGIGFGKIAGQGVQQMKDIFKRGFVYEPEQIRLMDDIAMESKGLEFSLYITKESLAQQGGYGLALKGAHHDEAWLIFEDMVRGNLPTFEDKAEALWWFPLWRTWFGLVGLCKLPWNDVIPKDNEKTAEPAKIMGHVQRYCNLFYAVTGRKVGADDLMTMSEQVYTFHRIFNLVAGGGTIKDDVIPYRAMGPVTIEEYEACREYYDRWFIEEYSMDISGWPTERKIEVMRTFREGRYENLRRAVYARRGWDENGVPTLKKVRELEEE